MGNNSLELFSKKKDDFLISSSILSGPYLAGKFDE